MVLIVNFLPILLFISLYLGTGIYFTIKGVDNAFYQLPPTAAIIPSLILGWLLYKGSTQERMKSFLDGLRHRDIMTMCIIFLLAGAFSTITKNIGSAHAAVNLALSLIPHQFLLIGVFLTAAFISTAIGTSLGTIATLGPIALELANQGGFSLSVGMGTVVAGSMFGDNLSVISDTTIAAVMSQGADMRKKLRINAEIAAFASLLTIGILFFTQSYEMLIPSKDYSLISIFPYLFLLLLAVLGINVFVTLILAIAFAGTVGYFTTGYSFLALSRDIDQGFNSMREIMMLSMMVGGLSGLVGKGTEALAIHIAGLASRRQSKKIAQLLIAKTVSIFDILLANNVIATIVSGGIAKEISKRYHIPAHYSAAWLDNFSCVFQGIIPYGAQILLASAIAGISPLSIMGHVYYCYILGIASVLYILATKKLRE
jgi:Na+/H+ antiporter NhaC